MDENKNRNSGYNWKYSGNDASDYRAKYTQGFDPDYLRHTAERRQKEEEERRQQTVRKKPVSRRQDTLFKQQEVTLEEEESWEEAERILRRQRAAARRNSGRPSGSARSAEGETYEDFPEETEEERPVRQRSARRRNISRPAASARYAEGETYEDFPEETEEERPVRQRPVRSRNTRSARNARNTRNVRRRRRRRKPTLKQIGIYAIGAFILLMIILLLANRHQLVITLNGDDPLTVGYGEIFTDPGATAEYRGTIFHLRDREVAVTSSHDVDTSQYGTYQIRYRATYKDQEVEAVRDVVIKDMTPPVITLDPAAGVVMNGQTWTDSFTATDDKDGDVSALVRISGEVDTTKNGTYEITYQVTDSSGNTATASRKVIVSSYQVNNPGLAAADYSNVIYLTFDDGPGPFTQELLDTLDKYNVKATFFLTDQNPECHDLIKEEAERGHTVANHTASHDYDYIYADENNFWADYDLMDNIIEEQTGQRCKYLRFPGGSSNTVSEKQGIMTELAKEAGEKGLRYFDWTITSGDAVEGYDSEGMFNNIVEELDQEPEMRSEIEMILLHDNIEDSVMLMEDLIPWCLNHGFVFLPITDDTPDVHHTINN